MEVIQSHFGAARRLRTRGTHHEFPEGQASVASAQVLDINPDAVPDLQTVQRQPLPCAVGVDELGAAQHKNLFPADGHGAADRKAAIELFVLRSAKLINAD